MELQAKITPRQQEIIDAILAHPELSGRKIAKLTGASQSHVAKVKSDYLPNLDGYERVLCLGPGPDHTFLSPDKKHVRFCREHRYLTRLDQPEMYRVVNRGA